MEREEYLEYIKIHGKPVKLNGKEKEDFPIKSLKEILSEDPETSKKFSKDSFKYFSQVVNQFVKNLIDDSVD